MSNKKKTKVPIKCKSPGALVSREDRNLKGTNVLFRMLLPKQAAFEPVCKGVEAISIDVKECFLEGGKSNWYEGTTLFG